MADFVRASATAAWRNPCRTSPRALRETTWSLGLWSLHAKASHHARVADCQPRGPILDSSCIDRTQALKVNTRSWKMLRRGELQLFSSSNHSSYLRPATLSQQRRVTSPPQTPGLGGCMSLYRPSARYSDKDTACCSVVLNNHSCHHQDTGK